MFGLVKTIGSLFDPVLNFFQQVWNFIVFVFSFLWDLIEGLYYGFNTIISHVYKFVGDISGVSFFADNQSNIAGLVGFVGFTPGSIIISMVFVAMLLILMRFIWSLIPFFKK